MRIIYKLCSQLCVCVCVYMEGRGESVRMNGERIEEMVETMKLSDLL